MVGTLVVEWENLWIVALPILTSCSAAGILSVFLWRATRDGVPHRRERCRNCVYEPDLLKRGYCVEACTVNMIPAMPLLLFSFTTTLTFLFLFYPGTALAYILPQSGTAFTMVLYGMVLGSCLMSTLITAAYLVQQHAHHREMLGRGAVVATLGTLLISPFDEVAAILAPAGLFLVLLTVGIELRARKGHALLGLNALGLAMVPLFVMTLVGLLRIFALLGHVANPF